MVVDGPYESYDGDEKQEHSHGDYPSDYVDAGHDAKLLTPCCHPDEQQPHQLKGAQTN